MNAAPSTYPLRVEGEVAGQLRGDVRIVFADVEQPAEIAA